MLNNLIFCKIESKINSFTNVDVATSKINNVNVEKSLFEKNVEKLLFNENVEKFAFEITIEMLFVANVEMLFDANVDIIM